MKKSSLLALSLASLVALVGCGKESSGSTPKALDKKAAKLAVDYFVEGTIPEAVKAILSFKQEVTISGSYADEEYPAGTYKFEGSFHIAYNSETYEWEVDPQEGEEWSEEDLADAAEVIEAAGLQYTVSVIPYLVYNYMGYDEEEGYYCTYFQEYAEYLAEYDAKLQTSLSPISWGYDVKQSGEDEEQGVSYVYKYGDHYEYNKYGYLTKYETYEYEKDKGLEDASLDGVMSEKESFSIKYLEYAELVA